MTDVVAARALTAISLAFHIIFSSIGVALPLLMVIAEGQWLRTKNQAYYELARKWAKAAAILFAIGAVSGTALSFEFGLLWPGFMKVAGGVIGLPFGLEGFAFFIEAIFIGIYLYGWDKLSPRAHWLAGLPIAIAGPISGGFIVMVNAWMNSPAGFNYDPQSGVVTNVDPIAAMFNRAWGVEVIHMTIAAYLATAVATAAVYAWGMLQGRRDDYHRKALAICLTLIVITAPAQFISGDANARFLAENQNTKFAAMEGQFQTQANAPLRIGGIPDPSTGKVNFDIEIPGLLSWLGFGDTTAVVKGLNDVPVALRPATEIIHPAFQIMVGSGTLLLLVALASVIYAGRKRRAPNNKWLLRAILISGPFGFLAIEAGWVVTELGRQPFIIYNTMRTADAVTTAPGLVVYLATFVALYLLLAAMVIWFLRQMAGEQSAQKEGSSLATT